MSAEHHWAGIASARLLGRAVVPGFVSVVFRCNGGEPGTITGSFVPGGHFPGLAPGARVELLLPRGVIGRAHLGERKGGVFAIEGALPWPNWRDLIQPLAPIGEGPEAIKRSGFLELRAGACITSQNWLSLEDLNLQPGQRVLMDYRNVTEILTPFEPFLDAGRQIEELGLRFAMVGSGVLVLGISRLASQMANLAPSPNVRVFDDYDEARLWLLQ
jgi:hypothetical protein